MNKDLSLEEIFSFLFGIDIKGINNKKNNRKKADNETTFNNALSKFVNEVDQKFSLKTLRKNGPFLTYMSYKLLKEFQKLESDLDLFHKTKFLQVNLDALSTKDKPVRKRRSGNKKLKQVLDDPEEQRRLLAQKHFLEKKQEFTVQDYSQSQALNSIGSNNNKNMLQQLNIQELQFQDLAEPNLNLIDQQPESIQQQNIEKQESTLVEEQINIAGSLTMESYKRSNIIRKKRKQYGYLIDNISHKVANKFVDGQDLEKVITANIQLGVKKLQNTELISVLLNAQPKVRIYSHLLPTKAELKTYEQGNRPVQELRGQNSNIIQEQLQDFGFGFGFLDDKPPIEQEPQFQIQQSQQYSQQYSQQMEIELTKNFTYSFQHSGLLFNSFLDRQDKSLKFYLLMCQCQKSKNFRIEQQDVLQFGPIQLVKK